MPVNYQIETTAQKAIEANNWVIPLIPEDSEIWYDFWQFVQMPDIAKGLNRARIFENSQEYLLLDASEILSDNRVVFHLEDDSIFYTKYNTKLGLQLLFNGIDVPFSLIEKNVVINSETTTRGTVAIFNTFVNAAELPYLKLKVSGIHKAGLELYPGDISWFQWYKPVATHIQDDVVAKTGSALTLYESSLMGLFQVERRQILAVKDYDTLIGREVLGEKVTWQAYAGDDTRAIAAKNFGNWNAILGDFATFETAPDYTRKSFTEAV